MRLPDRVVWPAMVLATMLFYSILLFHPQATIHWDLADVAYPAQKYFAQSLHAGHLPHWTPFLYSGMPFLSDPQTGAWYPLHWPFFLIGITPRSMAWELALHAFLALAGTYLLARKLLGDPVAALIGATFYAWGGYFAAHSSQLAMFETAALFPWLLWAALCALDEGTRRFMALTGLFAGLILLTGQFDAALYCFLGLACFISAHRSSWQRTAALLSVTAFIAILLSGIAILPWMEVNSHATRAATTPPSSLRPIALAAIMSADYWGALSGNYKGPEDIRQYYLYGGLLLAPLVVAGIARRNKLAPLLALIVPGLWYAFGPSAGLSRALAFLPGFRDAHAPIEIWFVPALGLAIAAGSGAAWFAERAERPKLPFVLLILIAADLWHFNMNKNPLVFARVSFEDLYGKRQADFESRIREIKQQPFYRGFYRVWASVPSSLQGPIDGPLETRTEVAYGAGLLELNRYAEYSRAIAGNPRLLAGLAITHLTDMRGALEPYPETLARISIPPRVTFVPDATAARSALATLDPANESVVESASHALSQALSKDSVEASVVDYRDDSYRIHYSAPSNALLRIAVPYAPRWTAVVDGRPVEVLPVDYALCGVILPAGGHDLIFRYRSEAFPIGAASSAAGALMVITMLLWPSRSARRVR